MSLEIGESTEIDSVGESVEKYTTEARNRVTTVISTLNDADGEIVLNLLQAHVVLVHALHVERKRNADLLAQITTSLPNYTKIKEELQEKFEQYSIDQSKDRLQAEVLAKKTINELTKQNALLAAENEKLRAENKSLSDQLSVVSGELTQQKAVSNSLQIQLDNIRFANQLSDFFRYIRESIINKAAPTIDVPKPALVLKALRSAAELDEEDVELEDLPLLREERVQDGFARAFLSNLDLDGDLMMTLYRLNDNRNDNTHLPNSKLIVRKKASALVNQAAFKEIKAMLNTVTAEHSLHFVKSDVIGLLDNKFIV